MKKRPLQKTVVNHYKLGNDLLIGHYGNEILSCDKGAGSSRDWQTYRFHYVARGAVVLSFCGKIVELRLRSSKPPTSAVSPTRSTFPKFSPATTASLPQPAYKQTDPNPNHKKHFGVVFYKKLRCPTSFSS